MEEKSINDWITADVKTCPHGYVFVGLCDRCKGWISVKDRLPPECENVLFYVPSKAMKIIRVGYIIPEINRGNLIDGEIAFWFLDDSENTAYSEKDVTHWMTLPEPPK
jgi:hypothetical protein